MDEGGAIAVLIRGPLGVGKTSVAKRLSRAIGAEYISIDQILEDHGLWVEGLLPEFLRANEHVADRARVALGRGSSVVVDGNFYFEAQIDDLLQRLPARPFVFTLSAPLEVCARRDRERELSYGEEAAAQVYEKSHRFEAGVSIDATRPIEAVVARILSRLPPASLGRDLVPGPRRRAGSAQGSRSK